MAPKTQPHSVKDNLASIAGWLGESNTFRLFREALLDIVGVFRGSDFVDIDGAFIVDPPIDFPFTDATDIWEWVCKQPDQTQLSAIPFDVKTSFYGNGSRQMVSFFVIVVPDYPDYLCILPARSYFDLRAVNRRQNETKHASARLEFRLQGTAHLTFPSTLAPFAVYKDDILDAVKRIIEVSWSNDPMSYINPSNGVKFTRWDIPKPLLTIEKLLRTRESNQKASHDAVRLMSQLLQEHAKDEVQLLLNPVQPLVCDILWLDKSSGCVYLVEHKSFQTNTGQPLPDAFDLHKDWDLLVSQYQSEVKVHARKHEDMNPAGRALGLDIETAGSKLQEILTAYGNDAKQATQEKWKNHELDYDATTILPVPEASSEDKHSDREYTKFHSAVAEQFLSVAFVNAFNEQCWKLGRHVCFWLNGNPSGSILIVNHLWSDEDRTLFQTSRVLPVSLCNTAKAMEQGETRCVVASIIPHHHPDAVQTLQLFEPSRQKRFQKPVCTAQGRIYIGATEVLSRSLNPLEVATLGNFALLPSEHTVWFSRPAHCQTCQPLATTESQRREWYYVQETEVGKVGVPGTSIPEALFLRDGANPLDEIYNFDNGDVHDYFDQLLSSDRPSPYVTTIHGQQGILQRQWNHGAERMTRNPTSPQDRLMYRVISALPPKAQLDSPTNFIKFLGEKADEVRMEEKLKDEAWIGREALARVIEAPEWGDELGTIVARSGFNNGTELKCDHCGNTELCRFLQPGKLPTEYSKYRTLKCKECARSGNPCTFKKLPQSVEAELRRFEPFRRHVPCTECWGLGQECDNDPVSCKGCTDRGKKCEREACEYAHEPGDDSTCSLKKCDKAHFDDGYENIGTESRSTQGYNWRDMMQFVAAEPDDIRIAACERCWDRGWEDSCDNGDGNGGACIVCRDNTPQGDAITCVRPKCKDPKCKKAQCQYAHPSQKFQAADMVDRTRKKRTKTKLKERFGSPNLSKEAVEELKGRRHK